MQLASRTPAATLRSMRDAQRTHSGRQRPQHHHPSPLHSQPRQRVSCSVRGTQQHHVPALPNMPRLSACALVVGRDWIVACLPAPGTRRHGSPGSRHMTAVREDCRAPGHQPWSRLWGSSLPLLPCSLFSVLDPGLLWALVHGAWRAGSARGLLCEVACMRRHNIGEKGTCRQGKDAGRGCMKQGQA